MLIYDENTLSTAVKEDFEIWEAVEPIVTNMWKIYIGGRMVKELESILICCNLEIVSDRKWVLLIVWN